MTSFLILVFGFMYVLMILNPLIFLVLKKRTLFILDLLVVIGYLVNWYFIIGTLGYEGFLATTWMTLMYFSLLFLFVSMSILYVKFLQGDSVKWLIGSCLLGTISLIIFEINESVLFAAVDNFAKYGMPILFLSLLLLFAVSSLLRIYKKRLG
ncbi:hypothetical protein QWY14_02225 [Planococcus sp. N028]|uniref:Uncharacterized protein n=1 Tax=Planococcus shixiaomingii TaxID=3058393 RepID=A0ABT8MY63_9BACL|nr:hypothetical protein [Planococcus sp. N028]MDN7240584.1 hypothetical protein [Planococcus sp. N028]